MELTTIITLSVSGLALILSIIALVRASRAEDAAYLAWQRADEAARIGEENAKMILRLLEGTHTQPEASWLDVVGGILGVATRFF